MSEDALKVVIAIYQGEAEARQALDSLMDATKAGALDIEDAALIWKDEPAKIHVKDVANISIGSGAAIGGLIGGILGLIAGPAGVVILGGTRALLGGSTTAGDEGISDERLLEFGTNLETGTSAVVAVVIPAWQVEVENLFSKTSDHVFVYKLSDEIRDSLEESE